MINIKSLVTSNNIIGKHILSTKHIRHQYAFSKTNIDMNANGRRLTSSACVETSTHSQGSGLYESTEVNLFGFDQTVHSSTRTSPYTIDLVDPKIMGTYCAGSTTPPTINKKEFKQSFSGELSVLQQFFTYTANIESEGSQLVELKNVFKFGGICKRRFEAPSSITQCLVY